MSAVKLQLHNKLVRNEIEIEAEIDTTQFRAIYEHEHKVFV